MPLVRTGVSVARWAAVTDRVWSVPVLAGDETLPAGYQFIKSVDVLES